MDRSLSQTNIYSVLEKITALYLLTGTILETYGWISFNFSFILGTVLAFVYIVKNKAKLDVIPKFLLWYFVYWIFSFVLSNVQYGGNVIPIGSLRVLFTYAMFFAWVKLPILLKYYERVALFCCVIFLVQEVMFYTLGYRWSGIIEQLPIAIGEEDLVNSKEFSARSSSLFSEPAKFAQFLLPILALELFHFRQKKNFMYACFFGLILLLTRSGNALFGLAAIVVLFFISKFRKFTTRNIVVCLVAACCMVVFASYYLKTEAAQGLLERQESVTSAGMSHSYVDSGFLRIWRGYFVFAEYETFHKVVGCDNSSYLWQKSMESIYDFTFQDETDNYFNTMQQILLRTGFVGLIIMLLCYIDIGRSTTFAGKAILAIFFILLLISALYMTTIMCLYFLLPYKLREEKNKQIEK